MSPDMVTICFRAPKWMADYLDSKGNRSEVLRQVIEDAKKDDGQPQPPEVAELVAALQRARQALSNLAEMILTGEYKQIAWNEAQNIHAALAPFEEEAG